MKVSTTKCFSFEAAHFLPGYDGACSHLHGHSYKLQVTVTSPVDSVTGMVVDFNVMKSIVKNAILAKYDHAFLNDSFKLPTAENMVMSFFRTLDHEFTNIGVELESVKLWETESSFAECRR
jgi:6-pyruvoyltetrahydropterin/6-carboxytetrahydropterin synthase